MEANPITRLGEYRLIRHLARGGMSDIYLADKEETEQLYAIKVVKQDIVSNYQHFLRERVILETLKHENILPIFDYCEAENGIAYYVTPYIEQGSLKDRLGKGPLSPEEAASILAQVGDALQFIHELGLVHRDIKPANILLDRTNHVWLADFGLAKETNATSALTASSCLLGTPYYMAPELIEEAASHSSDIYALGVVLYEMLTGTPPFTGQNPLAICWKHVYELPPFPSDRNPCISAAVEEVILRALEKKPGERFASARALVEAYQEALLAPTILIQPKALLAPTITIQPKAQALKAAVPAMLADTLNRAKISWLRMAMLPQKRQRRPFALAMITMVLLFGVSLTAFAVTFPGRPSAVVNANAQMILLPTHRSTATPVTPSPTATPKPKATRTPQATNTSAASATNNPTDDQGDGSHKHHKQKHHGKNGK